MWEGTGKPEKKTRDYGVKCVNKIQARDQLQLRVCGTTGASLCHPKYVYRIPLKHAANIYYSMENSIALKLDSFA